MPDISTLNNYQLIEYGAWGLSLLLGLWMLFDTLKTEHDLFRGSPDLVARR